MNIHVEKVACQHSFKKKMLRVNIHAEKVYVNMLVEELVRTFMSNEANFSRNSTETSRQTVIFL